MTSPEISSASSRSSTDDDLDVTSFLQKGPEPSRFSRAALLRSKWHWGVHALLMIIWVVVFDRTMNLKQNHCGSDLAHSPAKSIVEYSTSTFFGDLDANTPFKGPPTPEIDKEWGRLMSIGMIRITKDDLRVLGRDSYELHDGSGHLGFVDVFHQLHCLNMVRMCIYSKSGLYGCPDTTGSYHTNHCIDILRQAIMCHADTNIVTWDWEPGRPKPIANGTVDHTCRNFEDVFEWTKERQVTFTEIKDSVKKHSEEMGVEIIDGPGAEDEDIAKRDFGFEYY